MPIDPGRAAGAELSGPSYTWSEEDVILYNLALGAGNPPDDPSELGYSYEGDARAVPTFGTIPPFGIMMSFGEVDGLEISLANVLHGDHTLIVHSPIPTSGTVSQKGRIVDIHDKGRGALIVAEVAKAVVQGGMGGEPERFGIFTARFTGHVFPGETLVTRIWEEGDRILVETTTAERETTVLVGTVAERGR